MKSALSSYIIVVLTCLSLFLISFNSADPIVTLSGKCHLDSEILIEDLNAISELSLCSSFAEHGHFIKSFSVITIQNGVESVFLNTSQELSEEVRRAMHNLKSGDEIRIEKIEVMTTSGVPLLMPDFQLAVR